MSDVLSLKRDLEALLKDLEHYFISVETNKNTELNVFVTLESRIKKICDNVILSSNEERRFFRPLIDNVLQKSENLKDLLIKKKIHIEKQINSLNISAKAAKAYKHHSIK